MKPIRCQFIAGLAVTAGMLAAGCSTYHGQITLDPVGPNPGQNIAQTANAGDGALLVYTAYDVNPEFSAQDIYRPRYTDYQILTADGRPLQFVRNDSGTLDRGPVQLELPAGQYRVVGRANGHGRVIVPVTIAARKLTIVHLESGL